MWNLIRKDVILGRRILAINGSIALLAPMILLVLEDPMPLGFYVFYVTMMCAMLPVSLIAREDKFSATALTCSLPVTRSDVVTSRYLGGWLIAGGWATAVLTLGLAVPGFRNLWSDGAGGAVLTGFVLIGLVIAAFVPFTIRFGLTGVLAALVALQVLGLVLFMVALATGNVAGIDSTVGAIVDAIGRYHARVGPTGFAATVVVTVALLNWASWRLSLRVFRARDL